MMAEPGGARKEIDLEAEHYENVSISNAKLQYPEFNSNVSAASY